MTPTSIVAYLALFATVGVVFLLASLFLGRLLRSNVPTPQKMETYECGEPAVGSSFIQFDLRFYVVALVFIVFEVELALFFPPAVIFGKATKLMEVASNASEPTPAVDSVANPEAMKSDGRLLPGRLAAEYDQGCKELGIRVPGKAFTQEMYPPAREVGPDARLLAMAAMADLGVFFVVILVGFAYVWHRGDLDWVRAMGQQPVRLRVTR